MTPVWNESLWASVKRWSVAFSVLFILLILSAIPVQFAHLGEVRPLFLLMAIYHWTILRSSTLPAPVVFMIGLVLDIVSAWPLGMNALVFVAVQWLMRIQQKFMFGQSFLVIWAGFFLMALGAAAVQWSLFSLLSMTLAPVMPVCISVVFSTFLFPVLVVPLTAAHRALSEPAPGE